MTPLGFMCGVADARDALVHLAMVHMDLWRLDSEDVGDGFPDREFLHAVDAVWEATEAAVDLLRTMEGVPG